MGFLGRPRILLSVFTCYGTLINPVILVTALSGQFPGKIALPTGTLGALPARPGRAITQGCGVKAVMASPKAARLASQACRGEATASSYG